MDALTAKSDDFTRPTRKTPKRLLTPAIGKPQTVSTDSKASDELSSVQTRSPSEPKDADSISVDKKVVATKPKVTRQRIVEFSKVTKSHIGKLKAAGNADNLSKKTGAADNRTEKKLSGRPAGVSKAGEKFAKKKLLTDEKKSAGSGQLDVKRTVNVVVPKVDSNRDDKSSGQKRV